jgi:hypothetical protein
MNLEGAIRILQSRGFREAESFAEKKIYFENSQYCKVK